MNKLITTVAAAALLVAAADAGLTSVGQNPSGEKSFIQLLDWIYGSGFYVPAGKEAPGPYPYQGAGRYTNGSIILNRVQDFGGNGVLNLRTSSYVDPVDDQVWSDGLTQITAQAKWAGYNQDFGYSPDVGVASPSYLSLFNGTIPGPNFPPPQGPTWTGWLPSGGFIWGRADNATGSNAWYSDDYQTRRDNLDHMVTYEVRGLGTKAWLVFWDDQLNGGDRDFNDLVMEMRAIPVPGAMMLGAMGLSGLMSLRRRLA